MSLRRQLLIVSLLLLTLPWAGCQFVREVEGALRQGQEQATQATAAAIASTLSDHLSTLYPDPARASDHSEQRIQIYARPANAPVILDGYSDGWDPSLFSQLGGDPQSSPLTVKFQAQTRGDRLYLMIEVQDPQVLFHNPTLSPEANGDRVVINTWQDNRRQVYVISPEAPGALHARYEGRIHAGSNARRVRGHWQDTVDGYSLELEMPLAMTGNRLGFYVMDIDSRSGARVATLGNITALDTDAPPWLIYSPASLQAAMADYSRLGAGLAIIDHAGWQIYHRPTPAAEQADEADKPFWLLQLLYRAALRQEPLNTLPTETRGRLSGAELQRALTGQAEAVWYRDTGSDSHNTLSAATPIIADGKVVAALAVRRGSEQYLSLTDRAFSRLFAYSFAALGLAALGLLGYASVLSWRIRRLSQASARAIDDEGAVIAAFPHSEARDELGELSRHFAALLQRVKSYNDYLRSLSHKLAHELRTPLAVIQSSLENLEQASPQNPEQGVYVSRARQGLNRLSAILNAMSEASRLEESIRTSPHRPVDLVPLITEIHGAYRSVYRKHQILLDCEPAQAPALAVPDLIVQALDKLVDNAASFCPTGGEICLILSQRDQNWVVAVENQGPPLGEEMRERLFEPMVSLRERQPGMLHLGLGLHIVKLIVDYHRGSVHAENLSHERGVRFEMVIPRDKTS